MHASGCMVRCVHCCRLEMVSKFELSPHVAKCGRRPRPKFANVLTIDAMCDCAQCCMHALFLKYLYAISKSNLARNSITVRGKIN